MARSPANEPLQGVPPRSVALARPITTLVGRDDDIAAVATLTRRAEIRLLTLIGPGGVGKTRLATEVARRAEPGAFDLVGVAPLAAIQDPTLVPQAIARALAIAPTAEQPILDRIPEFIADRRVLLVVDNLEHLPDAVPLLADLLGRCPRLTILATSRVRLNLSGERLYPVLPLGMASASELFSERSIAVAPGFRLDATNLPIVESICLRLDCLPLAIELAAARLTVLPLPEILVRLQRPLGLLTGGPRDAPDRQRTMRSVIAWSYDLLSPTAQVLFRRLGVFVGGFTLDAAAAVAGIGGDVLDDLDALLSSSLVQRGPTIGGLQRFTMLETVREYALEQLAASGEEEETRRCHAAYVASAMWNESSRQDGPEVRHALDRIEIELENCRAAMAWCLESREAEMGIRIAGATRGVWWAVQSDGTRRWHERLAEGRRWLEQMLDMKEGVPLCALMKALSTAAGLAALMGDFAAADTYAREQLDRSLEDGDRLGVFWGHLRVGNMAHLQHNFATARDEFQAALDLAPGLPHPESRTSPMLVFFAQAEEALGATASARAHYEEAMTLAQRSANSFAISLAGSRFGRYLRDAGELRRAVEVLAEAVTAYVAQRRPSGTSRVLTDLALIAHAAGQTTRGERFLDMAQQLPGYEGDEDTVNLMDVLGSDALSKSNFDAIWSAGNGLDQARVFAEIAELAAALNGEPPVEEDESRADRPFGLTRRELEVLRLLAEGRSNRAIADVLSLSERTVERHLLHTYTKLGLESRAAAVAFALRHGLA